MLSHRLIARLDIKGPNVVKGIQMEGLRVVGKPDELAQRYANSGAHELLYIDTVASLYGRNQLETLIEETAERVFVPITVGGGIADVQSVAGLLRAGADKVAVNKAALERPQLIREIADQYGSQAICISIAAKRRGDWWECYVDAGRQPTGADAVTWAQEAVALGAGEILVTSIDRDGMMKGADMALLAAIGPLPVPLVYGGGVANAQQARECIAAGADAVAIGAALHYGRTTLLEVQHELDQVNIPHAGHAAGAPA